MEYAVHAGALWVFLTSGLAIIPLAGFMGKATEHLSVRVGHGLGGLLNATFGNAAEIIIAIMGLRAGLYDLVKASITGSIIGNVLLVFGLSTLLGGLKYRTQHFNRTAASLGSTMLLLSAIALVIPAIFHFIAGPEAAVGERNLSLFIAIVLMVTYALLLVFSLKTHSHLYLGSADTGEEHQADDAVWSRGKALAVLVASAAFTALMSELLVSTAEETAQTIGMSEVFVGVILVAIVGNAAEHSTSVLVALKDKMDLSINIAIGSSVQIALFAAPLLVFCSYFIGPMPMDLRFTTLEVVAVALSVTAIAAIAQDGETHWMEGVQLLAVYLIIGTAFFFLKYLEV